ncbi:MAG: bifunctional 4-hydroxy-2-oxoglutarate aldolase/2-dehydro-3-deoxy-phosphogluconate aldolase [Clostridia bacterium]|nr:bifunctional 4-hydroxy-2-oxoglutarate aldolase/2-dehydro-3-deoxy-phosphogluconate aldolase [Clostridia bacterium]
MNRQEVIKGIEENKIVVILRNFSDEQLVKTVDAIEKGGIRFAEVTFDSQGKTTDEEVASKIRLLSQTFAGRVHIGAGTVLNGKQVELAKEAGAEFIISPDTNTDVIRRTVELGLVSIPGAFTPTEATTANRAGADFVKLFPNSEVKPSYIKAISLPLSHIKFLAVGGITEDNVAEYIKAGATGVGVATAIVNKKLVAEGKFEEITSIAKRFSDIVKNVD